MASVSSLDKDMRNIRLSKYTPQAANEVRRWIESALGEPLAAGDVLDALKDGIALCKLMNLASPSPGVRFKSSTMPFVQMENISHFLRACQQPPISLHSHDIFQTVDLYECKDPAQVLQCIAAFSRRAHAVQPGHFPNTLGGEKSKTSVVTPQSTGDLASGGSTPRQYGRSRGASNTSETSSATSHATSHASSQAMGGRGSPIRSLEATSPKSNGGLGSSSAGGVSSWSKRQDEGATTPAWNIHQYGYMGGASQGNQGITFGGRRQITTPAPKVTSLAEKERKRKEQEEAERLRVQAEEVEHQRRIERDAKEEREKALEEQRWEEETRKQREREKLRVGEEKRRWEEEERKWKEEEENRAREEKAAEARLSGKQQQTPDARPKLQGQFLSQYQAEQQQQQKPSTEKQERVAESERVRELERQLEEAKEREARYERERQERIRADEQRSRRSSQLEEERYPKPISIDKPPSSSVPYGSHIGEDNDEDERSLLKQAWQSTNASHQVPPPQQPPRPLPVPEAKPPPQQPPRPLPSREELQPPQQPPGPLPSHEELQPPQPPQPPRPLPTPQPASGSNSASHDRHPSPPAPQLAIRPLPNPAAYTTGRASPSPTRKSPFTRPISTPSPPPPSTNNSSTPTPTPTPNPLKKPPFAQPSSLLSREMDLDRQRQAEWEEAQTATADAAAGGLAGAGRRQVVGMGMGMGMDPTRRVGGPREMPPTSK